VNPKGNKKNLKARQQGNLNAERSGLFSPRRQEEEARNLAEELARNPAAFLLDDVIRIYAKQRAFLNLLELDLEMNGVSDKKGQPRRQAGTYARTLDRCLALNDRIRTNATAQAFEEEAAAPPTEAECLAILRAIAHDPGEPATARIAAAQAVIRYGTPKDEDVLEAWRPFIKQLESMTIEELDTELEALLVPITTGVRRGVRRPWTR
jgi:hypothetical protein